MESLLTPQLLIAMGATFLAGIVRGFSGFGAAMVQAPVYAILFSAPQAVATMAGLGVLASVQLQPGAIRGTDWREIAPITLAAMFTVPLGAYLLLSIPSDVMRRGISAVVLALVLILIMGWRYPAKPGRAGGMGIGALSGLMNGATGVGGPPVVLYLLAGPNTAETNRANLISYYTFLNGLTFASLAFNGVVSLETLLRAVLLFPVQLISLAVGSWLFRRATDRIYRRIAYALLLGIALFGLIYD